MTLKISKLAKNTNGTRRTGLRLSSATLAWLIGIAPAAAPVQTAPGESRLIEIARSGSQKPSRGAVESFTGSVQIQPLFSAHDSSRGDRRERDIRAGISHGLAHAPARTDLIVTAGTGWVQQWGGPVEEIKKGDVVWIPAGVKHWHGATQNTAMTHIAIQEQLNGKVVEWMEKVTDDQYRN